jgi:outer membrane protein TolC
MGSTRRSRRIRAACLLGGLAFTCLTPLMAAAQTEQLPPPKDESGAVLPTQALVLTLPECVRLALDKQPALAAQRASLAAAETQQRGLDSLHIPTLLSPELPIRRKQCALGVVIASAGLHQAEWDTVYAVTRMYLTVLYARAQKREADKAAEQFRLYRNTVEQFVATGKGPREWTETTVDKILLYLGQAEARQAEAQRGIELATVALREAIGLGPDCCIQVANDDLPQPRLDLCLPQLIALALARRGEMGQAVNLAEVFRLEVDAQAVAHGVVTRTFAAASDIHVRPIPQGVADGEYRPGAVGPEMPPSFAGPRKARVERAKDLSARADAVVDKTRNLITLEVEDAFLRLREAMKNVEQTGRTSAAARRFESAILKEGGIAGEQRRYRLEDALTDAVLAHQAYSARNEALYRQTLALAALERITAGGFCPGLFGLAPARPARDESSP